MFLSIAYDAAGNLLNDTFHSYTWDAYGHVHYRHAPEWLNHFHRRR
jgi:YD repeat-containing protein